jgi:Zn finger protein HypA/HybF involved in hydrogenase expression
LQEDNPLAAGQSLGRYLEWTFGVLNENLKTPMPYKLENVYTLSEFFEPLKARINKLLRQSIKQHKLVTLFDEFETGTIFRNYCVHWKNEASQFTTPEIEFIFNKWIETQQMIYCPSCKSFVKYESIDHTDYLRCNCGTINLMDERHYI